MCIYTQHTFDGRADVLILFVSQQQDSKSILFQFSKNQIIPPSQNKPTLALQLFRSLFRRDQHLGLDPHNSQHRLKNINIKLSVLMHHILTHARFAIWVSIDLSIVLYNWETGRQRSNLLFALI